MTMFLLLHGAFHGGWCWDLASDELHRRGHDAIAPDLPIDQAGMGWDDYVDASTSHVDPTDEIVVVAHSLAGLVAPLVVEPLGATRLVLVAAFTPRPGRTVFELIEEDPAMMTPYPPEARHVRPDGSWEWTSTEAARERYYHDCHRRPRRLGGRTAPTTALECAVVGAMPTGPLARYRHELHPLHRRPSDFARLVPPSSAQLARHRTG